MSGESVASRRLLMLGPPTGWHADQLRKSATRRGHDLKIASYESISAGVGNRDDGSRVSIHCDAGSVDQFDAVLTRTMPASTMERITFRLATLHAIADQLGGLSIPIVNSPRSLEWSIDKYATLARLADAGHPTPPTRFVQTRQEAMEAFSDLGGDCVVKPLFGGEGRGVMRISDHELAWYSFSTLDRLGAVLQVQKFISPGGRDTRLLVIGNHVFGVRRINRRSFRTNVTAGGECECFEVDECLAETARRIASLLDLTIGSVDMIENDQGPAMFLEVNAIPGWKGAQTVINESIADRIIDTLVCASESSQK